MSQILEEKSKPKKKTSRKDDLFHQFENIIKNLDTSDGQGNRVEFRDFLQKLFDELKTKTESYFQQILEDIEMSEKPTARDLCSHVETQVSSTFIASTQKPRDSGNSSDDEHVQRQRFAKMAKEFLGKDRRFCGGEHTIMQSGDRQNPRANPKEKYIDLMANQMKTNLRNSASARKPKTFRCCKQVHCTCYHANTLAAVYGASLI